MVTLLKARRPEKYSDRLAVTGSLAPISVDDQRDIAKRLVPDSRG